MKRPDPAWEFKTKNLLVSAYFHPEETDPADHFSEQEDIDDIREGRVEWFWVEVVVSDRNSEAELGRNALGGCAYSSFEEFMTSHRDPDPMNRNCTIMRAAADNPQTVICHYWPSVVWEAVNEARATLRRMREIPLRA